MSRNGRDHTRRFTDLAAAVAKLSARPLVLDGEVVIYDQELRSRFEWLREPNPAAVATPPLLMIFDLLYFDRRDITARPLRHRARLEDPDGADLPSRRDAAKKLGSISSRVVLHPPPTSTQKCPHRRREATRFRP